MWRNILQSCKPSTADFLDWYSRPFDTYADADEMCDSLNTGKKYSDDVDAWYYGGVEQGVEGEADGSDGNRYVIREVASKFKHNLKDPNSFVVPIKYAPSKSEGH